MSVIGEAALSAFFELLGGKLLDSALNFVADHKQLHPQLKQWQSILPDIQAVLDDAEEKQIKSEGVKKWLNDLQDLAYDVDDILDEFAYEQLRLKLQKSHTRASTSKALSLYMQPQVEGSCSYKTLGKLLEPASGNKQPGSFLIDLRKMAFEDAFQLTFLVRAGATNVVAYQLLQVCVLQG
ncbi:hypothetical protein V6Z11_A11G366100 [Gossypium hirsutum]